MKLVKCYICGFGTLKDVEYSFNDGLTTFIEENGKGKTTLTAFIRAMLYGLSDTRKQSLEENPRKMYAPWSGGVFGGSLTVEINCKTYTIERTFGAKASEDVFVLRESESGMLSADFSDKIGEETLGLDEDGFSKTILFGEGAARSERHSPSIASRLSDAMGSDGDDGDYEVAIKKLDEARKFYHRRGGSGEISELVRKIQELELELDEIERCRRKAKEIESELSNLERMRQDFRKERRTLEEKVKELGKEKEHIARERVYRSMLDKAKEERESLCRLRAIFGATVPSLYEVENEKAKWQQAQRLLKEAEELKEAEDLEHLYRLFAPGTSFDELEEVKERAKRLEAGRLKLKEIEEYRDDVAIRIGELFPKKLPTKKEIDENIALASARCNSWILPTVIGVLLAILGVATGLTISPGMYAFVGTGAALILLGIAVSSSQNKKKRDSVRDFLLSIGASANGDFISALEGKRRDLVAYEQLLNQRGRTKDDLIEFIAKEEVFLGDFLARFPLGEEKNVSEHIRHLSAEYTRFYALSSSQKNAESREEKIRVAEGLITEVRAFVRRFGITEGDPFAILKDMIEQYTFQTMTVERLQRECEEYRHLHGLTGVIREDAADESVVTLIGKIDEKLREIEAKYAVNDRNLRLLMDRIEAGDEIEAKRQALLYKKARYEHNLALIKRTMDILTKARDVMSSKYLGKTRERFIYYENLISEGKGEFSVSSSFTLTINEQGKGRSEESYSRGIRDLYALAMQVALLDAMYPENPPFLILDDPFIAFDDKRCKRGVALIKKLAEERQILYFSCSRSRAIE